MDFVLASASPRRFELLQQVGAKFIVQISEVQEIIDFTLDVKTIVQSLAWQKAKAVAETREEGIILGADTIVVSEGKILGKPKNKEEAKEMLTSLSGKWHEVMTGVALVDASGRQQEWKSVEVTRVKFRNLTEQDIAAYIATEECMDKAGAYGIQGFGALLVEEIAGCYFNVVGLPLQKVAAGLLTMGVNLYDYGYSRL